MVIEMANFETQCETLCVSHRLTHCDAAVTATPVSAPSGVPAAGDLRQSCLQFDDRGWETGRCRLAQVVAPIPDISARRRIAISILSETPKCNTAPCADGGKEKLDHEESASRNRDGVRCRYSCRLQGAGIADNDADRHMFFSLCWLSRQHGAYQPNNR